jgi:hypothetical protein
MGMHREGPNAEFDPIERNIRRLVWWSLYIFEKILCIILGRPSSIDDAEVTTHVPDEEGRDLPPDMMAKAYEMVKLSYDIRRRAYWSEALPGEFTPSIPLTLILLKELDHWFATLPSHLQNDTSMLPKQRRGVLVL